jgi:hypothetical protein
VAAGADEAEGTAVVVGVPQAMAPAPRSAISPIMRSFGMVVDASVRSLKCEV